MEQNKKDALAQQEEQNDYSGLLRQAVAVIEHARTEIAQQINCHVSSAYWEIGKILHDQKIESGDGDSVVRRLSAGLSGTQLCK